MLREITRALLQHRGESAVDILGGIDAVKVRSCMTLFDAVSPDDIFHEVLDAFYGGTSDKNTLDYMWKMWGYYRLYIIIKGYNE